MELDKLLEIFYDGVVDPSSLLYRVHSYEGSVKVKPNIGSGVIGESYEFVAVWEDEHHQKMKELIIFHIVSPFKWEYQFIKLPVSQDLQKILDKVEGITMLRSSPNEVDKLMKIIGYPDPPPKK